MHHEYTTQGTCAKNISFDIDENGILSNVKFLDGCNGNTKGISALVEGKCQGYYEFIKRY